VGRLGFQLAFHEGEKRPDEVEENAGAFFEHFPDPCPANR
jgi:hypothetical protein